MDGLQKLKEIGSQKVYEQTHIAKKFVEDIFNGQYGSMNKIQFSGFISILEREYSVDLHEVTQQYREQTSSSESEPFVVSVQEPQDPSSKKQFLIISIIVIFAVAFFAFFSTKSAPVVVEETAVEEPVQTEELNNTTMLEAKQNLLQLDVEEEVEEEVIEPVQVSRLMVEPRRNLWVGIIDLQTYKRTQKMTSSPFELDASKDWLMVMGHGYVNFDINGVEESFADTKKMWFVYEGGTLRKISKSEFTEKNRGKAW